MIAFLGLFSLLLLFLFLKRPRYYLTYYWTKSLKKGKKDFNIKSCCFFAGWSILVLASANLGVNEKTTTKTTKSRRFILLNDVSGSMMDSNKKQGIGHRMSVLLKGNESFLKKIEKDQVGCVLFSDEAFIVSYLVDDPLFILTKLKPIDYLQYPLGQGTQFENALWGALDVFFYASFPKDDFRHLRLRMYPGSAGHGDVSAIKEKLQGDSIIVFTDGEFGSLDGATNSMSVRKILSLCKSIGVRVFVISIESIETDVTTMCLDTGGFTMPLKTFDEKTISKGYESILSSVPKEEVTEEKITTRGFSTILGCLALVLLLIWYVLKTTSHRDYAEV